MNREERIQRAAVAMAWAEGQEVQFENPGTGAGKWWGITESGPIDVFSEHLNWRVKPAPKLRPWTAAEIIQRMAERPLLVKLPGEPARAMAVVAVIDDHEKPAWVLLGNGTSRMLAALAELKQPDGSPCGVEVVE